MSRTLTRKDEAHYVIYRWLAKRGFMYPYDAATEILNDLEECGLIIRFRGGQARTDD